MKVNKNNYILLIPFLIIIGAYFIMQHFSISNDVVKEEINIVDWQVHDEVLADTSNWQTYSNEEYGFSFEYPENWIIRTIPPFVSERLEISDMFLAKDPLLHFLSPEEINILNSPTYTNQPLGFVLSIFEINNNDHTLRDWIDKRFDESAPWFDAPIGFIKFGKIANKYDAYFVHQYGHAEGTYSIFLKNKEYVISFSTRSERYFNNNTFKTILNTLNFI